MRPLNPAHFSTKLLNTNPSPSDFRLSDCQDWRFKVHRPHSQRRMTDPMGSCYVRIHFLKLIWIICSMNLSREWAVHLVLKLSHLIYCFSTTPCTKMWSGIQSTGNTSSKNWWQFSSKGMFKVPTCCSGFLSRPLCVIWDKGVKGKS